MVDQVYYDMFDNACVKLDFKPSIKYEIKFDHLANAAEGKIDFVTKTIILDHTLRLRLEKAQSMLRHEAMHADHYEEDQERYWKMSQIEGSYAFRILFHDTLLNPLETEARIFGMHNIPVRLPRQYLLKYNYKVGFVPLEWLIQNPVQAAVLLRLHSTWGHLSHYTGQREDVWGLFEQCADLTSFELVPEAVSLSSVLEEMLSKLQETVPDITLTLFA